MATIAIDEDVLKQLEEKAAQESRTADEVANELLRQKLDESKPYKLDLEGWKWKAELLVDVSSREKLYDVLDDEEEMKRRGF